MTAQASAAKEALEQALPDFLALFFPQAHAGIDWSRGYRFRDKELQQVVRDAELGRRYADKLAEVYTLDGAETWVLVHIEIQGQADPEFAERMYVYHYRLFDRYRRDVVSLAVLTDAQGGFRPSGYERERWGCSLRFRFPMVKLLDWRDRAAARLIDLVLRELFSFRTMQTDPNLANYRHDPVTDKIVLLDFGAVTRFDAALSDTFRRLLNAALDRDRAATADTMLALGYFDTTTAPHHRDLILQMFDLAMAPLRQDAPFDFGTTTLVEQISQMGMALGRDRDLAHVPPADTMFLHRKIGGIYMVAARLRARVPLGQMVARWRHADAAA
jgi:hypothetical protein